MPPSFLFRPLPLSYPLLLPLFFHLFHSIIYCFFSLPPSLPPSFPPGPIVWLYSRHHPDPSRQKQLLNLPHHRPFPPSTDQCMYVLQHNSSNTIYTLYIGRHASQLLVVLSFWRHVMLYIVLLFLRKNLYT